MNNATLPMDLSHNTVLITGGATGIGLALAERFLRAGSDIIVCGRREDKLREVKARHPRIHTRRCDVAKEADRESLAEEIVRDFPQLNVLVNNAGVQRRARFTEAQPWSERREEIAINFDAPLHLTALLLPHLRQQPRAAIVNVSSGLAFVPAVFAPMYSATKAAIHSFSMALRQGLLKTPVRVIEIVPPAVDTELGGARLHTHGVPLDEFADAVMKRVADGETEVGYGTSEKSRLASRAELDESFRRMSQAFE